MDSITISIVVATVPSILSGAALIVIGRYNKRSEKRESSRRTESILILKNIDAIGTLTELTAKCVKNGAVNGDMDAALAYRTKMKHDLEDHLIEVNADAKC